MKAGCSGEDAPKVTFSSVVGYPKQKTALVGTDKDYYIDFSSDYGKVPPPDHVHRPQTTMYDQEGFGTDVTADLRGPYLNGVDADYRH